jgi:thiamine pyrophosphate-dependent acetolactate synthase large subunit-like protein
MSDLNGGQLIAKQLKLEGVDLVFGILAGPMLEAFAAFAEEGIRVIGCRHEEQAGFMAAAWGYITGKPGVVVVGAGPAVTNTITSLYVAQDNGWPLVVLGGSSHGSRRGLGAAQEAPQVALAAPTCKWAIQIDSTYRIPEYIHLGLHKAATGRPGAVYIDFPGHHVADTVDEQRARFRQTSPRVFDAAPDPAGVAALADLLSGAEKPLLLIGEGSGWHRAGPALERLVNLGIPFVTSPMGRGTVPDDHELCANAARTTALAEADAVLMVGGRFNWIFHFGRGRKFNPNVRLAQITDVADELYSAADVELGVVGNVARSVEALTQSLGDRTIRSAGDGWASMLKEKGDSSRATLEERMSTDAQPISHLRLWKEVRDAVERNATVVVDGEVTLGVGRVAMPTYLPQHRLDCGPTACVGTGVPFALGAKLARPNEQVVAVLGDYSFGASAMEIETAAREGINVLFVVDNNSGIVGHIIQDQLVGAKEPRIATLLPAQYQMMAQMVGGFFELVENPADLKGAIRHGLDANKVGIINVLTDPNEGIREGYNYFMG